jgi:RNA polymerase sigma-70 factor (ECF subfamily)
MTEQEAVFNGHLRAFVARRVDAASVDDVLGEIYLRVAQHQDKFKSAENPLAWLYRVAGNIVTDHYRRHAAERTALRQAAVDASEADSSGAKDNYSELAECLIPMIRQLPEDYREALLLTDIQGNTQAEAAAQLGLSVSGMKSRVQRGRVQLKKALQRCCEIEVNRQGRIVDYMQRDCSGSCGKDRK